MHLERPKILQMNGMGLKDFESRQEAMDTADQLIAQSVKEFGHKYACISYGNELTDKFSYVLQGGRTKTWYKDENKTLESTKNPKNAKMLADQGMFAELLGVAGQGQQGPKTVSEILEQLKSAADLGRSLYHNTIRDGRRPLVT